MSLRFSLIGILAVASGAASATEVLFPAEANLGEEVGIGLEVSEISDTGSPSARRPTVFANIKETLDEPGQSQFDIQVFKSLTDYTKTSKKAASASDLFGFSIAAGFNRTKVETRTDDRVYATIFAEALTHLKRMEPGVETAGTEGLVEEVRGLVDRAHEARSEGKFALLADIQREFKQKYGTGYLQEIQQGALFTIEYNKVRSTAHSFDTEKTNIEAGFSGAKVGNTSENKVVGNITSEIESLSGSCVCDENAGLMGAMTFSEAREVLKPGKNDGEADGETEGKDWAERVYEAPKPIRYRYVGYDRIDALIVLVDVRQTTARDIATDVQSFGDKVDDSHSFVAYRAGWAGTEFGTIPKLIPVRIDLQSPGYLGVTFAVERTMLGTCDPNANEESEGTPHTEYCGDSKYPFRLSRWLKYKNSAPPPFDVSAQDTNDPLVLWSSKLIPRLLVKREGLGVADYATLFNEKNLFSNGVSVEAIVNNLNAGAGGVRFTYKFEDAESKEAVLEKLAEGSVVIQTLADTPAGAPVALTPYHLGSVRIENKDDAWLNVEYSAVPSDAVDALVEMLNGQNVDHESSKVQLYRSGCSEGALELGQETCKKQLMIYNTMDSNCRVDMNHFPLRLAYPSLPWAEQACLRIAECVYGPHVPIDPDTGYPDSHELHELHRPIERPAGFKVWYVAEFTCKNEPTGQFMVEVPLPQIERPTFDNIASETAAED